ncbi:MAG TPA: cytochrome c peroxidase, partial [Chryseolinea sp.]
EDKVYIKLFREAYGEKPTANTLFKAIASFERTLVSGNSKFDRYFYQKDTSAFNESEKRGYRIFFDDNYKMHCATCHTGVNLTNNSFQNNGLYLEYPDQGRYKVSSRNDDKGKFKVPTLRNVAVTAPYMHDGSLQTLEDVMEHYNSGGKGRWHPNRSPHVHVHRGLELTETEKSDLISFLKTLTDEEFLSNPDFHAD